jgi:putative ABC transport system substrate-binding protein
MTRRRDFLMLTGAAALWPLSAYAQQRKVVKIGFLTVKPQVEPHWGLVRSALRDLGYAEGMNVQFDLRAADTLDLLATLAAELVRMKVDVIVALRTPAAHAAKGATSVTPIVILSVADPVGAGIISSLSRPGSNITGVGSSGTDTHVKALDFLCEIIPGARRVAAILDARDPFSKPLRTHLQEMARTRSLQIDVALVQRDDQVDQVVAGVAAQKPDAAIVQGVLPPRTVEMLRKYRIPTSGTNISYAEAGAVVTYFADVGAMCRKVAVYIDRIVKGASPADLPVEEPTKFNLIVNARAAKALGIKIPQELRLRADKVIE